MKIDRQHVAPVFEQTGHIGLPAAKHVIGLEDAGAVELDIGVGVKAIEAEFNMAASFQLGGQVKTVLINPVFLVHPLRSPLVEPKERVVEQMAGHEIGLHRAGHGGGMPVGKPGLTELPALGQAHAHWGCLQVCHCHHHFD